MAAVRCSVVDEEWKWDLFLGSPKPVVIQARWNFELLYSLHPSISLRSKLERYLTSRPQESHKIGNLR